MKWGIWVEKSDGSKNGRWFQAPWFHATKEAAETLIRGLRKVSSDEYQVRKNPERDNNQ